MNCTIMRPHVCYMGWRIKHGVGDMNAIEAGGGKGGGRLVMRDMHSRTRISQDMGLVVKYQQHY